jgi:hypothetical protein
MPIRSTFKIKNPSLGVGSGTSFSINRCGVAQMIVFLVVSS